MAIPGILFLDLFAEQTFHQPKDANSCNLALQSQLRTILCGFECRNACNPLVMAV